MRSAPRGGNIDCSEIAERILEGSSGNGKIINFTLRDSGEMLQTIEDAVRATPTQVDWRVDTSRRNWLLAPARILGNGADPAASPAFDERVEAATRDQSFCAQALSDLDAIMRTLGELTAVQEDPHGD
jgi:hypothetical protein